MKAIEVTRNWPQSDSGPLSYQPRVDLSNAKARLHLNEAPIGLPHSLLGAAIDELHHTNRYPEPGSSSACEDLSRWHSVNDTNLLLGNGCDEVILIAILTLARGGRVVTSEGTYPGYRAAARLASVGLDEVPLKDWRVDLDGMLGRITRETKVIIVCNPHNPCGTLVDSDSIRRFVIECNKRGVISILDEAYIDFSTGDAGRSIDLVREGADMLVLRTFSKAAGLAGLRAGYAVGPTHLIAKLRLGTEALPFSVNRVAQRLVSELCVNREFLKARIIEVIRRRTILERALRLRGLWHLPSETNFVFMAADPALSIETAAARGIFIRDCNASGHPGYWRVSVGTSEEMDHLATWLFQKPII